MPLAGPVKKFKVVVSYTTEGGATFEPIWADSREQAEEIAVAMFKDSRRDADALRNIRACAVNPTK
jgi:hypothetical protein